MSKIEEFEDKYIELILKRCVNLNNKRPLFVVYSFDNKEFVNKLINKAKELGINDIYLYEENVYKDREKLLNIRLEDIDNDPYFDTSIWNEYANKDAAFVILVTEHPKVLDDVDATKMARANYIENKTKDIFRKKQRLYQIPWTIAALPNKLWAKEIFEEDPNSYEKLYLSIFNACMIDTENPIESWNNYLTKLSYYQKKLNELEIKKLYYKNSLGTDLEIELPNNVVWNSAASESKNGLLVNMPSYEIFTSPNYTKTNGIVYSSKPLIRNGTTIEDFYFNFKDGKIVSFGAKTGYEVIEGILNSEESVCYLGEVALVDKRTPIANSNITYRTTLFDENASSHLALGNSFAYSIKNGNNMTKQELLNEGLNSSNLHIDFMIGTNDLNIIADTKNGKQLIFKDGKFNL